MGADPVTIDAEYEFGVTFGVHPPAKWWKFTAPRFGIGYRFDSANRHAVRFTIGVPFGPTLPTPP